MTAKEYLSQAQAIKTRLAAMSEQLKFLRDAAEYVGPYIRDMPKPSRNIHKTEDACIRVIAFEERMDAQYAKLTEISETINPCRPLARRVVSGTGTDQQSGISLYDKGRRNLICQMGKQRNPAS